MNQHDQNYMTPEEKELNDCRECGDLCEGDYCSSSCYEASEL
jgi:hypothetical protein